MVLFSFILCMVVTIVSSQRFEGLHNSLFPLLSIDFWSLSTWFRSNCTVSDIPHNRFRFLDRVFPFMFLFPNKSLKTKIVRIFSRLFSSLLFYGKARTPSSPVRLPAPTRYGGVIVWLRCHLTWQYSHRWIPRRDLIRDFPAPSRLPRNRQRSPQNNKKYFF